MSTESSITMTPPEPPMDPHEASESKSIGMSSTPHSTIEPFGCLILNRSPNRRIFDEEPPGMTALNWRPGRGPPQISFRSRPNVTLPDSTSK